MEPTWLPDRIVLRKNPRYWGGEPKIDEVHFCYSPDGNAAVDALLNGDVDYVPTLSDPDAFDKVLHDPRVKILMVPGFNVFYLGFHLRKPPFDDPVIRHAAVQALNVHRMALIGRGAATAAAGPLPPHMQGYDPAVRQRPYDPEAARDWLTRAGYDGRPVRLVHYRPASFARHLALAVERDLGEAGVKVLRQEAPTWSDVVSATQRAEGDLFIYSWHMRTDDAQGFLRALFHSSNIGVTNLTAYSNPTVDALLDRPPPHQFSTVVQQVLDDAPMVFLSHWTRVAAHTARVRGLRLNIGVLPEDKLVGVDVGP
jgi:peptide/nickel transport system substrate-binding protein